MARTPKLEELEAIGNEAPPVGIPPGADVTVKFKHNIDPSSLAGAPGARRYSQEIEDLAGEEFPDDEGPSDPLTSFVNEWSQYIGYPLKIVRLPDPAERRRPGQTYNRPCFNQIEQFGDTNFDPINLISTIQILNGDSGGIFRLWLTDEGGTPIPGARLDRIAIADPPKSYNPNARDATQYAPYPQPPKPEPSALELRMQDLQEKLLSNAVARLLEPPPTPAAANPANQLNDEDRLTLLLVKEGGLLPTVVQKLATLAGAPENAGKETWQDRLLNAGVHLAENNPAVVERVSSTIERIVNRILPGPAPQHLLQPEPAPVRRIGTVAGVPHYTDQPQAVNGLPETSQLEDDELEDEEDPEIMAILEDLFALLTSTDPLVATHPTFLQLQRDYPVKFRVAVSLIASQELDAIIEWIKDKSPLYTAMLESPAMAPHYRQRLTDLQILCRTPAQPPQAQAPPPPRPVAVPDNKPEPNANDNAQDTQPKASQTQNRKRSKVPTS